MSAAIVFENITKRFRKTTALDRVSFEVPAGQIFGLLGPNGAGKTTLMRILVGILGPDEGTIRLSGDSTRRIKERIGYLPEERGLYPKMKVLHLLRYFAALKGLSKSDFQQRFGEAMEKVGLSGQENKKVEELSKGNQQRVQLLMTLMHKPDFLVLDEPFSGLDPIGAQKMKDILREEIQRGATVVISTHRMEDAEELCQEIALIHRGRLVRAGSLDRLQKEEGRDELVVQYEDDPSPAQTIPGVRWLGGGNGTLRLRIENGIAAPEIIRELTQRIRVLGVQRHEPTLHDIFIELVNREESAS